MLPWSSAYLGERERERESGRMCECVRKREREGGRVRGREGGRMDGCF